MRCSGFDATHLYRMFFEVTALSLPSKGWRSTLHAGVLISATASLPTGQELNLQLSSFDERVYEVPAYSLPPN
jgi:uncharacterized protein (UPF0332 family)